MSSVKFTDHEGRKETPWDQTEQLKVERRDRGTVMTDIEVPNVEYSR